MTGTRLDLFTGEAVADLSEMRPVPPTIAAEFVDDALAIARGIRTEVRYLPADPEGFSVVAVLLAPGATITRHTHDVDCLYLLTHGSIVMGGRRLEAGGGFFVGADQPDAYRAGPDGACVVEVRHGTTFGTEYLEPADGMASAATSARARAAEWDRWFAARDTPGS